MRAGKISQKHGSLLGKIKEVNALEQELLEHIVESVGTRFILYILGMYLPFFIDLHTKGCDA